MMGETLEVCNGFKETELGSIPMEWEVVSLGRVCKLGRENVDPQELPEIPYVGLEHIDSGEPKLRRWGSSSEVRSSKHHFVSGDVLYGKLRPYLDKAVLAEFEGVCSTDILVLKANADCALPEFLVYLLHTQRFRSYAISTTSGTNLPRTRWTSLKDFKLALPPLPEQRRIAHVLNTIQRAIAAQDTVIAAARELKRSLMQRLFTYGPDPEPAPTKETEIGEIPEHWEVVRLGDVLQTTQYGLSVRADRIGTYPMLRMNNLVDGRVDISDLKYVDLDEDGFAKFSVRKRDVLFNRTNSYELVGKTAIFDLEGNFVFASYLIRVVPDVTQLLPEYLNYYLNWDNSQRRLKMLATRGVSQSNISATKLKRFTIGLPSLAEQEEIACTLSVADRRIEAEEQRKVALQALFKSMLHQLMTGRVRV